MANLYPENKSYGTGATKPLSIAEFQANIKKMRDRTAQGSTAPRASVPSADYAPTAPVTQTTTPVNFKLGEKVDPTITPSIPYKDYPGKSSDIESPISPQATIKTLTSKGPDGVTQNLGQYVQDPTQPGKAINWFGPKNDRKTNFEETALIKAGYDPKYFEVDHTLPLALGGGDTLGNKQILDKPDHDMKSRIQQVAIVLKQAGKISDREAQGMAMNWEAYKPYIDQVPQIEDSSGNFTNMSVEAAQKAFNSFKSTPALSWKSFKAAVADAPKAISNPFLREFAKGVAEETILLDTIVPEVKQYAQTDKFNNPADQRMASWGKFAGQIFGGIGSFMLVSAALTPMGAGLALGARGLGLAKKAKMLEQGVVALEEGTAAAKGVQEGMGIKNLAQATEAADFLGTGANTAKMTASEIMKNKLKAGAVQTIVGQAHNLDDNSLQARTKKALGDFAMGTFVGGDPTKIKSYVNTMGASTMISMMMGEDIRNSLANGATMTALHGMGGLTPIFKTLKNKGTEASYGSPETNMANKINEKTGFGTTDDAAIKILQEKQTKLAEDVRRNLLGEKYDPKTTGSDPDLLNQENVALYKAIAEKARAENWDLPQINKAMREVNMSGRALYKNGLDPEARTKADMEDLVTLRKKLIDGSVTNDGSPKQVVETNKALKNSPNFAVRDGKLDLSEIVEGAPGRLAVPVVGMTEAVSGPNKTGALQNAKGIADELKYAKDNPGANTHHILTPEEMDKFAWTQRLPGDYEAVAVDSAIVKENGQATLHNKEKDARIAKAKASGEKLQPWEISHVPNKNPDISSGVYTIREVMGPDGQKVSQLYNRTGSVMRESNPHHRGDLKAVNGQLVPEWNLNKDAANKIMEDNGMDIIRGVTIIMKNKKTGLPFQYFVTTEPHIEASKAINKKVSEFIAEEIAGSVKSAISAKPKITETKAPENFLADEEFQSTGTPEQAPPDFLSPNPTPTVKDAVETDIIGKAPAAEVPATTPTTATAPEAAPKTGNPATKSVTRITVDHPQFKARAASKIAELSPKGKRATTIYNELESAGVDAINNIDVKAGGGKDDFIRSANRVINNIGFSYNEVNKAYRDPKMHLTIEENNRINERVKSRLKAVASDLADTKFPPETAITFRGEDPTDSALIKKETADTERKIGLSSGDVVEGQKPSETLEQIKKENKLEDIVKGGNAEEGTLDRMKRQQKEIAESPFAKIFAQTGTGVKTKGGVNITAGTELKKNIDKIVAKPENTAKYGFNKAMAEALDILFPNKFGNYSSNFTLNSLLQDTTGKGRAFKENYYKATNEQGHYFSQPKDVITAGNKSGKALIAAREARKNDLANKGDQPSAYHEGLAIQDPLQGEDTMAKDLVAGELRNYGLLSADAGLQQDALAGASAALGLLDEWANIIKKPGEKRVYIPYDEIKAKVLQSIGAGTKSDAEDYMAQRLREEIEAAKEGIKNRPK